MSRVADFVVAEVDVLLSDVRELAQMARSRLDQMRKDPQKDGVDSEALVKAYARVDRVLAATERR